MRTSLGLLLVALLLLALSLAQAEPAPSYFDDDESLFEEYPTDNELDRLLQTAQKRACVRRGGNCDHRPKDCCVNSTCRCNLWGANCRCQRKGLFQKWGK
ncbi:toxin Tbo-IT2-like isoform X2 [Macrosteles quadrilineatus]|uniref:toxin Tbo-IT2-like isoform X2 n=1 Tax=Macrosteles quadrilineatus TaxID=74068 RepID=UPI0023E25294|nr:toxin Tbo-IT2-like isoform X2 [Macrosteles quadrilineatus]XP_054269488.1 toxin Tbo-IT2-like isoform X2 [Macrosteles quadrilineatus]